MAESDGSGSRGLRLHARFSTRRDIRINQPDSTSSDFHPFESGGRCSAGGRKEFLQFLHIALGSAAELETQLLLAERIGYLPPDPNLFANLISVKQLINGLIRSLKKRNC